MLAIASRAPSGSNNQPWRVDVLSGQTKARFRTAILAERASGAPEPAVEYRYYRTIGRSPISAVAAKWVGRFTGAFELISTRLWSPNSRLSEIVRRFPYCGDRDGANRRTLHLDEG
jgi:nitroreductase